MTIKVSQSWIRYLGKAAVTLLQVSHVPEEGPEPCLGLSLSPEPWALSPEPWALAAGGPGPRWRQRSGCCFRFPLDGCGGPFLQSPAVCQFRDPISVLVVPTLVSLGPGFVSWKSFYVSVLELTSAVLELTSAENILHIYVSGKKRWAFRGLRASGAGMAPGCPTGSLVIVVGPSLYPLTFHMCCMRFFWTCPACHVTCMYLRTGKLILLI